MIFKNKIAMANKDDIFLSFINHPIINDKYGVVKSNFPKNLREGLSHNDVIIKTIAMIVESQEKQLAESDSAIHKKIMLFLNQEAL